VIELTSSTHGRSAHCRDRRLLELGPKRRRGKMTDSSRWKATIHVAGLAPQVTVTNIHDAFIPFGEIADVTLPKNDNPNATEPHRGFAYVEFEDADDVKEAIDNMDQSELFGRILRVSAAKPPKSADEGLGSKTAVWEQVSGYSCFWTSQIPNMRV
jgi:RNA recognition motif-containing protein